MRKETQEIIDLMLKEFGEFRSFETEHFIYWIRHESYVYAGDLVTREEFKYIKQYAAYNGTLPSVERNLKLLSKEQKQKQEEENFWVIKSSNSISRHPEIDTETYSREKIMRYSKTYNFLEYYSSEIKVRAQAKPGTSRRVLVMYKKNNVFKVNNKGYVMIYGNRWLSLKNLFKFKCKYSLEIGEDVIRILLKSMIGKDWVLNLEMSSINISNKNARQANSIEHAIEIECGAKPAKIIKKAFNDDINSVINLYSLIESSKIHDITNFLKKNWISLTEIINSNYNKNDLLFYYFLCKDNRCEKEIMNDYFKMLQESRKKINLKITSYSTIKKNHDELSRQILLKKSEKGGRLKIRKYYPEIKSLPNLEVEKIKTVDRLNQESAILHHCVHSYKDRINKGECAIYSLYYEGSTYTLQLSAERKKIDGEDLTICGTDENDEFEFKIKQLRGKFNCSPPESMKSVIERMCEENNLSPLSGANVYFYDNKDKRKVVQIGDGILDRVDSWGNISRVYEDMKPFVLDEI